MIRARTLLVLAALLLATGCGRGDRVVIVAFGDSTTTWKGPNTNWVELLRKRLPDALNGRDIELIDAGVSSDTTDLARDRMWWDVVRHRPDVTLVQFGINGDPKVTQAWRDAYIMDEMVKKPNAKGMVTFARRQSDTRTTQVFINMKDNGADFDDQGFAPFGKVVEGMDEVILKLSNEHGERPQMGDAPKKMVAEGSEYIKKTFPKLDYIKKATIL